MKIIIVLKKNLLVSKNKTSLGLDYLKKLKTGIILDKDTLIWSLKIYHF